MKRPHKFEIIIVRGCTLIFIHIHNRNFIFSYISIDILSVSHGIDISDALFQTRLTYLHNF